MWIHPSGLGLPFGTDEGLDILFLSQLPGPWFTALGAAFLFDGIVVVVFKSVVDANTVTTLVTREARAVDERPGTRSGKSVDPE